MGLTGTIDASVYTGLRDVLSRHPKITTVGFEPDSISKEYIRASIAPDRIEPPTGPEPPLLEVEWRFRRETESYRIHYADPNTGFNYGWHRDEDHRDFGSVHFQCEHRSTRESDRIRAEFTKSVPTEILWTAFHRLFETKIPAYTSTR
jgi:hypothetical protein